MGGCAETFAFRKVEAVPRARDRLPPHDKRRGRRFYFEKKLGHPAPPRDGPVQTRFGLRMQVDRAPMHKFSQA